jgi:hypothetical protein
LFQQLLSKPPIPLNQAVKGLKFSPELEAVVMQGLERDLGKRSKTVQAFATAFTQAVQHEDKAKTGFFSSLFRRRE